jgi:hypothetical protein
VGSYQNMANEKKALTAYEIKSMDSMSANSSKTQIIYDPNITKKWQFTQNFEKLRQGLCCSTLLKSTVWITKVQGSHQKLT